MARLRTVKPGLFTNDLLAEIEPLGRLLFIGLWCIADREGRLEDRPRRIKAEVLPYDDADVDHLLDDLATRGFIIRYTAGDNRFIQVVNFGKHQSPHVKENASTIPAPYKPDASTVQDTVSAPPVVGSGISSGEWGLGSGDLVSDPIQPPSDPPDVDANANADGASAPVVGGEELAPSKKKGDAPETRPPLALVPQVASHTTSDASELAAFIPLARRVAETAKLTTYDTYAMARAIRKHRTHDPDTLLLEAAKAAEWIANKQTGKARRQMTVGFLDNWFGKVNNLPPEGDHHATTSRAYDSRAYAGRATGRSATQQPDPHKDGVYAAFVD